MSGVFEFLASSARSRPLLALLAPALIVGVVAMHTLLATTDSAVPIPFTVAAAAPVDDQAMTASMHDSAEGASHHGGDDDHSSLAQDCGGLLAACIALLLTAVGLLRWRRGRSRWVLWLRPHPTLIGTGSARSSLELLTPLQRTTVLRC